MTDLTLSGLAVAPTVSAALEVYCNNAGASNAVTVQQLTTYIGSAWGFAGADLAVDNLTVNVSQISHGDIELQSGAALVGSQQNLTTMPVFGNTADLVVCSGPPASGSHGYYMDDVGGHIQFHKGRNTGRIAFTNDTVAGPNPLYVMNGGLASTHYFYTGEGVETFRLSSGAATVSGYMVNAGQAEPALSAAGTGRIYFDATSNTYQFSQNGSAYVAFGTGGLPGGADTYVQFNDVGVLGGDAGFTYVKSTYSLGISGSITVGSSAARNCIAGSSSLQFMNGVDQLAHISVSDLGVMLLQADTGVQLEASTTFSVPDTTASATPASGCAVFGGGIGVAGSVRAVNFNGVALTAAGSATNFLAEDGTYQAIAAAGGGELLLNVVGTDNLGTADLGSFTALDATAINNIAIGRNTLALNTTGEGNIVLGAGSGATITTGDNNILVGQNVMATARYDSTESIAIGTDVLSSSEVESQSYLIAIGNGAMKYGRKNTSSISGSIAIGRAALQGSTSKTLNYGDTNIAIGNLALYNMSYGSDNLAIGTSSGNLLTTGNKNTLIGNNTSPTVNSISGSVALGYGMKPSASYSLFIGYSSPFIKGLGMSSLATATLNVYAGGGATFSGAVSATTFNGVALTTAGVGTSYLSNDGTYKAISSGGGELDLSATGTDNLGTEGLDSFSVLDVTATGNIAIGRDTLKVLTTGGQNVVIGDQSGTSLTTGSKNTLLGAETSANATNIGVIALGYGMSPTASYSMKIGYNNNPFIAATGMNDTSTATLTLYNAGGGISLSSPTNFTEQVNAEKASTGTYVSLTSSSSITPNFSSGNYFNLTLAENTTLNNPSGIRSSSGQAGVIAITQDSTGSRTMAFGSYWKFAGGTAPTLTTTADAVDLLCWQVLSSTMIVATIISAAA